MVEFLLGFKEQKLRDIEMTRLIALCVMVALASSESHNHGLDEDWKHYKATFHKNYATTDEGSRRLIWEKNLAHIEKHNTEFYQGKQTFTMGQNHLSDMTPQEINHILNGYKGNIVSDEMTMFIPPIGMNYPREIDWRKHGLVTGVKSQGKCGSCWAFSATGSLEGQQKKQSGKLVSLSEQNLVDCSNPEGNHGCNGGMMDQAFKYIKRNHGIDTEDSYTYEAKIEKCRFKPGSVGATVEGYVKVQKSEDILKKAVASVGPISVGIDAGETSFLFYNGGIYDDASCSSAHLNHAVLVVGYGTSNGQDYWLVKNSWGTHWGEGGYIRMSRNKHNQCGIATEAIFPFL